MKKIIFPIIIIICFQLVGFSQDTIDKLSNIIDNIKFEIDLSIIDSSSIEFKYIEKLLYLNDSILQKVVEKNELNEYLRNQVIEFETRLSKITKNNSLLKKNVANNEDYTISLEQQNENYVLFIIILSALSLIFLWLSISNYNKAKKSTLDLKNTKEKYHENESKNNHLLTISKAELKENKKENIETKEAYITINKKFNLVQKELYEKNERLIELEKKIKIDSQSIEEAKEDAVKNIQTYQKTEHELLEKIDELQNQNMAIELNKQNAENELSKFKSENDYLKSKIEVLNETLLKNKREIDSLSVRVNEKMLPESRLKKDEIEINLIKLEKIERLKDLGTLNEEEYSALKNKILSQL